MHVIVEFWSNQILLFFYFMDAIKWLDEWRGLIWLDQSLNLLNFLYSKYIYLKRLFFIMNLMYFILSVYYVRYWIIFFILTVYKVVFIKVCDGFKNKKSHIHLLRVQTSYAFLKYFYLIKVLLNIFLKTEINLVGCVIP